MKNFAVSGINFQNYVDFCNLEYYNYMDNT